MSWLNLSLLRPRAAQAPPVVPAPVVSTREGLTILNMIFDICKATKRLEDMPSGEVVASLFQFHGRGLEYLMLLRAEVKDGVATAGVDMVACVRGPFTAQMIAERLRSNSPLLKRIVKERSSITVTKSGAVVTSSGENGETVVAHLHALHMKYFPNDKRARSPKTLVDMAFDVTSAFGHSSPSRHPDKKECVRDVGVQVGDEEKGMKVLVVTFTKDGVRNARIHVFEHAPYQGIDVGPVSGRLRSRAVLARDAWKRDYREIAYISVGNVDERSEGEVDIARAVIAALHSRILELDVPMRSPFEELTLA